MVSARDSYQMERPPLSYSHSLPVLISELSTSHSLNPSSTHTHFVSIFIIFHQSSTFFAFLSSLKCLFSLVGYFTTLF